MAFSPSPIDLLESLVPSFRTVCTASMPTSSHGNLLASRVGEYTVTRQYIWKTVLFTFSIYDQKPVHFVLVSYTLA